MLMIIACITMLIDHLGQCFFDNMTVMRIIGRIAMPIYAYLISEGFDHTHDKEKYFRRMLVIAAVSQLPYMIMFDIAELNVCFAWAISITILMCIDNIQKYKIRNSVFILIFIVISIIVPMDYGIYAVIWVLLFRLRKKAGGINGIILLAGGTICMYYIWGSILQGFAMLAIPVILICEKADIVRVKNKAVTMIYRAFYPAHMIGICVLQQILAI